MKLKWSLVKKISLYFVIIMITAFCLIYFGISRMMITNNENNIGNNMSEMQENVSAYIKQTLALRADEIREFGFDSSLSGIIEEMNLVFGAKFGVYSKYGMQIYTTEDEYDDRSDIEYAKKGYSSYTIDYTEDHTLVHYSFPIEMMENEYILRIESDYTYLYENSEHVTNMVLVGSAAILLGAFIMLVMMIVDVISPIKRLSMAIRKTAINPEETTPIVLKRKDEIAMLANDYNYMADTIKEQMQTIEKEKENLNKTLEYRKAFFDNITHELKTPLTIIIGYAEMMEQTDFEDKEFNKKGLENIITEGKRLRDMVTGLLDSSRETSILEEDLIEFDIAPVIADVAASMNIKAQRYGDEIICLCKSSIIKGSPNMIHRLMINLFDNAIKYGKTNSDITVTSNDIEDYCEIKVLSAISEEHPINDIGKIFMPFYRSREDDKKEAGSVGLGLAICKSIAIAHHGNITAEIQEDKVIFKITLPILRKESI